MNDCLEPPSPTPVAFLVLTTLIFSNACTRQRESVNFGYLIHPQLTGKLVPFQFLIILILTVKYLPIWTDLHLKIRL